MTRDGRGQDMSGYWRGCGREKESIVGCGQDGVAVHGFEVESFRLARLKNRQRMREVDGDVE